MISAFHVKKKIQLIIILSLLYIPFSALADCQVTLQWDANDPAPEGYRLFGREEGQDYNYDDFWWQGDHTFQQCTLTGLDEKTTYYFIIRAYNGDDMSGDSNEVRFNYSDNSLSYGDGNQAEGGASGSGCFIQTLLP